MINAHPKFNSEPADPPAGTNSGGGADLAQAMADATPSMARFLELKARHPDCILWYRMGDFYELFFDDAVAASAALSIVLTKRGKYQGQDIAMCGVPVHRADEYLHKLIKAGYRVAVCEQLEDPAEAKKRGAKSVVQRDVVRIVTPGTLTEDTLLEAKSRNLLTAVFLEKGSAALASLDISTGETDIGEVRIGDLASEFARLQPSEILVSDAQLADPSFKAAVQITAAAVTPLAGASFDSRSGAEQLKSRLGVSDLAAFGAFSRQELASAGGLLRYVQLTQLGAMPVLRPPTRRVPGSILMIDAASRASLELVKSASGQRHANLLSAMDRTVTGAGARELLSRLATPIADAKAISRRLDAVEFLLTHPQLREAIRSVLRVAPDAARALSRLSFGRGGPRDLGAVRDGLAAGKNAAGIFAATAGAIPQDLLAVVAQLTPANSGLADRLTAALEQTLPITRRDGGFIASGYYQELDEARALRDDSRSVMAGLEARYAADTGIKSLKVRHNNILGFFVEVSQLNAKPLQSGPHAEAFRHRQTMANAMRFTTAELSEIEGRIASATERANALEQEIFADLATAIAENEKSLLALASALGELDHFAGLAALAEEQRYVRPKVDDTRTFVIEGGRHPVVEQALAAAKSPGFIENDCALDPPAEGSALWLVTGPNMAGKSTFLRQNALIAVMAQIGSFVPARAAHIGVVDRLFSRVGAADDLARGRSTFMVEMVETAAILNQATPRSLIILDEVGRGTATFDGLSIAWAAVEYLHDTIRARVLFATHYHELTALSSRLEGITNVTMDVREWKDDIVFLHRVKDGAADRSYGLQVAKLAGLPGPVLGRARQVLAKLEKTDRKASSAALNDLPLFQSAPELQSAPSVAQRSAVDEAVASLRPDELSPKAALEFLYYLKELAEASAGKE